MPSLFEAYITNLGKYTEGMMVGETLKFPTTTEEVQALLKRIGVDGVRYSRRVLGKEKSRRVPILEQLRKAQAHVRQQPRREQERVKEAAREDR